MLKANFPEILKEDQNGNISVQMSTGNLFGRMEADTVIDTKINRDTKNLGWRIGMFHSLKNKNTLRFRNCRWHFCKILFIFYFMHLFIFLKFKIDSGSCYFYNGPIATTQHWSSYFHSLYVVVFYVLHIGICHESRNFFLQKNTLKGLQSLYFFWKIQTFGKFSITKANSRKNIFCTKFLLTR